MSNLERPVIPVPRSVTPAERPVIAVPAQQTEVFPSAAPVAPAYTEPTPPAAPVRPTSTVARQNLAPVQGVRERMRAISDTVDDKAIYGKPPRDMLMTPVGRIKEAVRCDRSNLADYTLLVTDPDLYRLVPPISHMAAQFNDMLRPKYGQSSSANAIYFMSLPMGNHPKTNESRTAVVAMYNTTMVDGSGRPTNFGAHAVVMPDEQAADLMSMIRTQPEATGAFVDIFMPEVVVPGSRQEQEKIRSQTPHISRSPAYHAGVVRPDGEIDFYGLPQS